MICKSHIFNKQITLVALLMLLLFSCSKEDDSGKNGNNNNDGDIGYDESATYIGLNFNEQLDYVDFPQIAATETTWIRGFFEFFQLYNTEGSLQTSDRVLSYMQLKPHNYNTILNIKFNFVGSEYPAPGSDELNDYMDFLDKIYDRVWDATTIIVVGNEPFIETDSDDFDSNMYNFYVTACERTKAYSDSHTEKPIYFGAFDAMERDYRQNNQALIDLLEYSKNTPWIQGVDMHIHHDAFSEMTTGIDFVNDRIRDDQRILISEFSLVKAWRANLTTTIPSSFASNYGYASDMLVHQYINLALQNQRPREEWVEFLSSSPWFENRKHYLVEAYDVFKSYPKFFIGTYAFRQAYPFNTDFTANTTPWVLNGIYANRTVETDNFGEYQFNYEFINDFVAIQEAQ